MLLCQTIRTQQKWRTSARAYSSVKNPTPVHSICRKVPVNLQRKYAKDYRVRYTGIPSFAHELPPLQEEIDEVDDKAFVDWFLIHQPKIQAHAQAFWQEDLKTGALAGIISLATQVAHAIFLVRSLGSNRKFLKRLLPMVQLRMNAAAQADPLGAAADELLVCESSLD